MKLLNELEKLKSFFQNHNTKAFKKQIDLLKNNFISEKEIEQISAFVDEMVKEEMKERNRAFYEIELQAALILNREVDRYSFSNKDISKKIGSMSIH